MGAGVCSRNLSISRPISALRSVSSGSSSCLSESGLSSPELGSAVLDSPLDESYAIIRLYFFFVGIVGRVRLVLGPSSASLLLLSKCRCVSQKLPLLNFLHLLHRVMAFFGSSGFLGV